MLQNLLSETYSLEELELAKVVDLSISTFYIQYQVAAAIASKHLSSPTQCC